MAYMNGHNCSVLCLTHHKNNLYSGGTDGIIRIWNTDTCEKLATLRGRTIGVICLTIHDNKLYSGNDDGKIRVWKI